MSLEAALGSWVAAVSGHPEASVGPVDTGPRVVDELAMMVGLLPLHRTHAEAGG